MLGDRDGDGRKREKGRRGCPGGLVSGSSRELRGGHRGPTGPGLVEGGRHGARNRPRALGHEVVRDATDVTGARADHGCRGVKLRRRAVHQWCSVILDKEDRGAAREVLQATRTGYLTSTYFLVLAQPHGPDH